MAAKALIRQSHTEQSVTFMAPGFPLSENRLIFCSVLDNRTLLMTRYLIHPELFISLLGSSLNKYHLSHKRLKIYPDFYLY